MTLSVSLNLRSGVCTLCSVPWGWRVGVWQYKEEGSSSGIWEGFCPAEVTFKMKPETGAGVTQVKDRAEGHFRQKEERVPAPWGRESVASSRGWEWGRKEYGRLRPPQRRIRFDYIKATLYVRTNPEGQEQKQGQELLRKDEPVTWQGGGEVYSRCAEQWNDSRHIWKTESIGDTDKWRRKDTKDISQFAGMSSWVELTIY